MYIHLTIGEAPFWLHVPLKNALQALKLAEAFHLGWLVSQGAAAFSYPLTIQAIQQSKPKRPAINILELGAL